MRIAFFAHSILADWKNGRAHFLRGLARELSRLRHEVCFYEAGNNDAACKQTNEVGRSTLLETLKAFPFLKVRLYRDGGRDPKPLLRQALAEADVAFVSQCAEGSIIRAVPELLRPGQICVFHDSQYRLPFEEARYRTYGLERYDVVLACAGSLASTFRTRLGLDRVEVLHEAADTDLFYPRPCRQDVDLLLIANGDRDLPLREYFLDQSLVFPHLRFCLYGTDHGEQARQQFRTTYRVDYRGWVPNVQTPPLYARSRLALHLHRDSYAQVEGSPTIRPFEAFATRTCLLTGPWQDTDGLFNEGEHYLRASSPAAATELIRYLLENRPARERIAEAGYRNLLARHTCRHRAVQLLGIVARYHRAAA
ncbi:MAG: glycosyltransferase [Pseudomonadota bacterium]